MNEFKATDCIRFGWETFKKRPWFFIGAMVLYFIVLGVISAALGELGKIGGVLNFLTSIANWGVQILAGMGLVAFLLKAHDNPEIVSLNDFWHPQPFLRYLVATLLQTLAVVGGIILLIVPGIIFGIMFAFANYLVVDKNMRAMDAMRESRRITYGHKWDLFLLMLLSLCVVILGLVCLIVGIFVAAPVCALAFVHAYRLLESRADAPIPATPATTVVG